MFDIVDIAFGICLIFFHQTFMLIIIAVYLIALPIVRIILNPMHLVQFYHELPRFLLALVLILLTPEGVLNVLCCPVELMAKKNLVDSGDLHEAFQKTDRSVFAGVILPYLF